MKRIYLVRCGTTEFRLGHVFTQVTKYKPRKYPEEMGNPPEVEWTKPVRMAVEGIHAYQRDLDFVGSGLTCALLLTFDEDPGDLCNLILGSDAQIEEAIVDRSMFAERWPLGTHTHARLQRPPQ